MSRPTPGKLCRRCRGLKTVVVETRPDPDNPIEPTIWRVRECEDCGRQMFTVEIEVDPADARRALSRLGRERQLLAALVRAPRTLTPAG